MRASRNADPLALADARARLNVRAQRVRIATGSLQDARQLAVAAMDDAELKTFRDSYKNWLTALEEAKQRTLQANWHGEAELADTREWISAADAELHVRGPPAIADGSGLHGPAELQRVIDGPPPVDSPELSAFRDTEGVALERSRLVELREQLDIPRDVPDTALRNAYELQQARVLVTEAGLLKEIQTRTSKALAKTVKTGRGALGEEAGRFLAKTHDDLRAYGQALESQIDQARGHLSLPEAKSILSVSVDPALLAPPPLNQPYRPEALSRIAFNIRAAEGTDALPRAPPLVIEMLSGISAYETDRVS